MQYEKDGQVFEFTLDYDMIADMEEKDPDFDLMSMLDSFEEGKVKFSVLRRLSRLLGMEFEDLKAKGLDLGDLLKIFTGCIGDMGFTSAQPE